MTEDQISIIDIVSDAVKSINNCLQCRICLDTISSPCKTRCGHSFCRTCISTVLSKKDSKCPLCNSNLQRRSISKDKHIEKSIKSFTKLLDAIQKDVNVDILNHQKNPRNTREGYESSEVRQYNSSHILNVEEKRNENISSVLASIEQPGCSSLHQDIIDKRNTTNREFMKDKIAKNNYTEEMKEKNNSLTDNMSGVYPLLSSPQLPTLSITDDIVIVKENRIKNWLKSLSNMEHFENPNGSPKLLTNLLLDDTVTVVSGTSLMSPVSNIKMERESYISDNSDYAVEEASNSMKAVETSLNNTKNKEKTITKMKPFLEQKVNPDSAENKLKYKTTHARARHLAKFVNKKPVKNSNDSVNSNNNAINSISKQQLLESCNATKETWNRVDKIGKEMRSKKKKLKSLDISKESTNTTFKNRKLSITNLQQIDALNRKKKDEPIKIKIDPEEEETIIECSSTYNKSNDTIEQKSLQNTSFISLEKEGRVPIMSLCREQMDDIIGVATIVNKSTNHKEGNSFDDEDQKTVPKKRLSLRKSNDSKNSSNMNICDPNQSSSKITPVMVNLEERFNILYDSPLSLSPRNEQTTSITLSVQKNQTINNTKCKEVTTMPNKVVQSSNTKCNLPEQINQDEVSGDLLKNVNEIVNNRIVKSTRRNDNIDLNNKNLITNDREIRVVPFNKLGTVFKKRRKVKFYKLGPVKKESLLNCLTTTVLNSCKTNLITFEETNDLLETFNMKEQCNLLERNKSIINSIVGRDISNNQIDLLKDKDMNCLSKKSTQDSLDVLLISLKELNNENIVNVNEQRSKYDICKSTSKKILENHSKNGMCSKPMITSIVKMISSEDDSQLKYLNLESMVQQPTSNVVSNNSIGLGSKRKSDKSNDDSSLGQIINDKKRKFIDHNVTENVTRNIQIKESSDENDSDNSKIGNNVTQINKFNVDVVDKINNNENINTVISLSSESENNMNDNKLNALNKSKKHNYKRIMIAHSSSDTDTSQTRKRKIDVNENKDKKKVKVNVKEVMTTSDDSDDDNLVNEILSNWCNDSANNSIKSMKKMNFNKTKDLKVMVTIPQSIDFDTWNNYDTPNNIIPEKELPERSNNDIIDKVKMIQMDENNKVISNKIKKDIDDLEEAEIITDSLGRNFFTDEENIIVDGNEQLENRDKKNTLPAINSSYMDSNDLFADFNGSKTEENFDDTLVENLDGSNKENKTTGYLINNKNDNIICKKNIMTKQIDEDKRRTTVPATIITNITTTNKNMNTTLISDKEKYLDRGKSKGQLIEQKDTSCEYDSLMNVTQDQLLLKALEEDLFGTGNSRSLGNSTNTKTLSQERRLESSSQTPTKSKKNLKNAQNVEEFSSDEDEIIENTPDKKFMEIDRSVNSKARKSLTMLQTTSPASSKKFQQVATKAKETTTSNTTTPSFTVSSKLKNPIDQNKIQPLHQSTPKIIKKVFYRDSGPSCYEDKNKSIESNKNLKEESRIITSTTTTTTTTNTTTNTTKTMETTVNNKRLCFVWSSLTADQIDCIKKLCNLIDATWTQNFSTTVTHVIVSTKDHTNAATKTLKFLQGIAHGKFVVSFKWIVECLKEGTLIDEEPYEAVDCYTLEAGPRKSRLRENDLFKGFAFLCIEPFQNITVIQFQDLLRGMGGTIVQNMNTLAVIKDMHKIILIQNEMHTDDIVANWYNMTSAVPVSCDWVVECISQYRLLSCYTHLHDVVQEDVLKLGYPEEMIDPDEFNSTSDTSVGYKSR